MINLKNKSFVLHFAIKKRDLSVLYPQELAASASAAVRFGRQTNLKGKRIQAEARARGLQRIHALRGVGARFHMGVGAKATLGSLCD